MVGWDFGTSRPFFCSTAFLRKVLDLSFRLSISDCFPFSPACEFGGEGSGLGLGLGVWGFGFGLGLRRVEGYG